MAESVVKTAVLASGSGSNFKALAEGDIAPGKIELLLTDNKNAGALGIASKLGIKGIYMYPGNFRTRFGEEEERCWAEFLLSCEIELVCLAGFMRILKGPLIEAFSGRIMNIHPSLLPSFPGLDSQGQAFNYGVKIAGCTVHYVDRGTDTGPVILQDTVPVLPGDTRDILAARILEKEHRIYPMAVKAHCCGGIRVQGRHVYITGENDVFPGLEVFSS